MKARARPKNKKEYSMARLKEIIIAKAKARGIEAGEEIAKELVGLAFDIVEDVITASDTKIDDAALPVIAGLKVKALALVDKIDGHVG